MNKTKSYKTYNCFRILLILVLITISSSCNTLSDKVADEAFLKENPTYSIVYSVTGEGWDGTEYRHIAFKKPNDEKIYKVIWTFVRQDDGTWKVTGRVPEE